MTPEGRRHDESCAGEGAIAPIRKCGMEHVLRGVPNETLADLRPQQNGDFFLQRRLLFLFAGRAQGTMWQSTHRVREEGAEENSLSEPARIAETPEEGRAVCSGVGRLN